MVQVETKLCGSCSMNNDIFERYATPHTNNIKPAGLLSKSKTNMKVAMNGAQTAAGSPCSLGPVDGGSFETGCLNAKCR